MVVFCTPEREREQRRAVNECVGKQQGKLTRTYLIETVSSEAMMMMMIQI